MSSIFYPERHRLALVAAIVTVIAAGVAFFGVRYLSRAGIFRGAQNGQYAVAKLEEAERHYQKAIKALWEAVSAQEKNYDTQVIAVFHKNLELIDASLAAWRQVVLQDPQDIESRNFLLAVYKGKADLLAEMVTGAMDSAPKRDSKKT